MASDLKKKISADDVISKLKDDGDFDRLRLKIVRQLKQNEDLRNNIISVVKQSAALHRPGAENMKPRQLCDAIHDEIRETAMNHISDGLWEIIRSADGMKTEITETVQSVYGKILNPERKSEGDSTSSAVQVPISGRSDFNGPAVISGESNGTIPNGEQKEPAINNADSKSEARFAEQGREPHHGNGQLQKKDGDSSLHAGFSSPGKRKRASDANDEDPDIPPGFG